MAFATNSNRPQPLWQPPPTACLTASGAASEAPSLLIFGNGPRQRAAAGPRGPGAEQQKRPPASAPPRTSAERRPTGVCRRSPAVRRRFGDNRRRLRVTRRPFTASGHQRPPVVLSSVRRVTHDQMGPGPTGPDTGRGWCLLSSGGGGVGKKPWYCVLVCSWRRPLADRHSLPFPSLSFSEGAPSTPGGGGGGDRGGYYRVAHGTGLNANGTQFPCRTLVACLVLSCKQSHKEERIAVPKNGPSRSRSPFQHLRRHEGRGWCRSWSPRPGPAGTHWRGGGRYPPPPPPPRRRAYAHPLSP